LQDTVDHIESKIRNILGLNSKKGINRLEFKRYLNEVFIPGRLSARNNAENQFSFFLSPFTDKSVSIQAYKIVDKLGPSLQFEEDMIKKINPDIASAQSDHGFDFLNGEPVSNKLKSFLIDFVPVSVLYWYYSKRTSGKNSSGYYEKLVAKSKVTGEGLAKLQKLNLPIDIKKLVQKPDLMPLVLAMGYLLKRLDNKISINDD
jgi:hypothetical protein